MAGGRDDTSIRPILALASPFPHSLIGCTFPALLPTVRHHMDLPVRAERGPADEQLERALVPAPAL